LANWNGLRIIERDKGIGSFKKHPISWNATWIDGELSILVYHRERSVQSTTKNANNKVINIPGK